MLTYIYRFKAGSCVKWGRRESSMVCNLSVVQDRFSVTLLHIFSGDVWAGAERMIWVLLKELSCDCEMKITAVAFNEGTLTQRLRQAGVEVIVLDESKYGFLDMVSRAAEILRHRGRGIVHSHGYKANIFAWILSRRIGARWLVSTVHSLPEMAFNQPLWSRVMSRLKVIVDKRLLRERFTRVVAVSQDIKDVLVKREGLSERLVTLIYNGIEISPDMARSTDQVQPYSMHIGTVARMVPVKNLHLFINMAAEIRKQSSAVRFSILGDGPMKNELVTLVGRLGLEDRFTFEAPRPDPIPYFQSVDIYVNTSVHEGLPLSLLEAMACGKPIVAPRVGGIPEILTDGQHGLLVANSEASRFVESCLRLVRDSGLRRKLGEQAAERVRDKFSSVAMAASYRSVYRKIVSGADVALMAHGCVV